MGKSTLVTTIFVLRLQHSQQGVRLGKLLELIGLVSAETNDVTQSLRSVGLPLSWKSTHKKSSFMGNVYWRHCEYCWWYVSELLISKKRLKWPLPLHPSQGEWALWVAVQASPRSATEEEQVIRTAKANCALCFKWIWVHLSHTVRVSSRRGGGSTQLMSLNSTSIMADVSICFRTKERKPSFRRRKVSTWTHQSEEKCDTNLVKQQLISVNVT